MINGEWFSVGKVEMPSMCKFLITTDGGGVMARQPKNPFHPGEILLEEFLEPEGVTQAALAERIGWTKTRLNELIKGKRGITASAALDLADALGTSPKLWMNLQATFDLDKAAKARRVA
jgi:addiction module HigA family antidote